MNKYSPSIASMDGMTAAAGPRYKDTDCPVSMESTVKERLRQIGGVLEELRVNLGNTSASLTGPRAEKLEAASNAPKSLTQLIDSLNEDVLHCRSLAAEIRDKIGN